MSRMCSWNGQPQTLFYNSQSVTLGEIDRYSSIQLRFMAGQMLGFPEIRLTVTNQIKSSGEEGKKIPC